MGKTISGPMSFTISSRYLNDIGPMMVRYRFADWGPPLHHKRNDPRDKTSCKFSAVRKRYDTCADQLILSESILSGSTLRISRHQLQASLSALHFTSAEAIRKPAYLDLHTSHQQLDQCLSGSTLRVSSSQLIWVYTASAYLESTLFS